MMRQFKFLNTALKTEIKTRARRLLIGWAIWSILVFILFAGFWFWHGMPKGPDGIIRTLIMMIGISVIFPPVVWVIGKATIG